MCLIWWLESQILRLRTQKYKSLGFNNPRWSQTPLRNSANLRKKSRPLRRQSRTPPSNNSHLQSYQIFKISFLSIFKLTQLSHFSIIILIILIKHTREALKSYETSNFCSFDISYIFWITFFHFLNLYTSIQINFPPEAMKILSKNIKNKKKSFSSSSSKKIFSSGSIKNFFFHFSF